MYFGYVWLIWIKSWAQNFYKHSDAGDGDGTFFIKWKGLVGDDFKKGVLDNQVAAPGG